MARIYRVLTYIEATVHEDGEIDITANVGDLAERIGSPLASAHADEDVALDQKRVQETLDANFFNSFIEATIEP